MVEPKKKAAPRKRAAKKVEPEPEFKLIEGEPPVTRRPNADTAFWTGVRSLLEKTPGKWARVKIYPDSKNAAGAKASSINLGKSRIFPKDLFEARGAQDPKGGSLLYMIFKGSETAD